MSQIQVPLLDLKEQYRTIKDEILAATQEIYESQHFILGPHVEKFEKTMADFCKTNYAVGVSSGTDALLISLMVLGVGVGDWVATTPYTFFATGGAIARMGANPLFVDIEKDAYTMDPKALEDALMILADDERKRVKAILPVHLYGQCADMTKIVKIAKTYDIPVIGDAAQAIGAMHEGRMAGSMGTVGCFSFFPSKNLGAFGDAGMVTCDDEEIYEKLKMFRIHGMHPKYIHRYVGGNFRIDALQAAILQVKMKYLHGWIEKRRQNAQAYKQLFHEKGLSELIRLPRELRDYHVYNQYVIWVPEQRDEARAFLLDRKIQTEVYYPIPLHMQECFSYLGHQKGDFPQSELAAKHTLALPIYPDLIPEQLEWVAQSIADFYLP